MQESTRFCNYSNGKFGSELTFVYPAWWDEKDKFTQEWWKAMCVDTEKQYMVATQSLGFTAQQARGILTNDLKAEIYMTGFEDDWENFLELRATPLAHPDMQMIAYEIKNILKEL